MDSALNVEIYADLNVQGFETWKFFENINNWVSLWTIL